MFLAYDASASAAVDSMFALTSAAAICGPVFRKLILCQRSRHRRRQRNRHQYIFPSRGGVWMLGLSLQSQHSDYGMLCNHFFVNAQHAEVEEISVPNAVVDAETPPERFVFWIHYHIVGGGQILL